MISHKNNKRETIIDISNQLSILKKWDRLNPRAKFVIILSSKIKREVSAVFAVLWKYRITNSIILLRKCSDEVETSLLISKKDQI
jgi:hypothetical protein